MKLAPIRREDMLQSAVELDQSGENLWSEYWIYLTERRKEYPFKQLVRRAYEIATGTKIDSQFFQSNDGYRNYIAEKFAYPIVYRVRDNIPFFTQADIEYFAAHAGKRYQKEDAESRLAGDQIKKTIFAKTNTWARALNLDGFEVIMDNSWQRSGSFAKYSWARIYRTGDSNKKVFFTVGVDAEEVGLIYKLDCYFSSYTPENALTPGQHKIFKRIVENTGAGWQQIPGDELVDYTWEDLVTATREFIEHYTPLYDEVIRAVWGQTVGPLPVREALIERPVPTGTGGALPVRTPVAYSSNADYDLENRLKKQIGDWGEGLVIRLEQQCLRDQGRSDLAAGVGKVLDWEGYDILSYYPDGRPKRIEVKTTVGTSDRPFFWSVNEYETMLKNVDTYCLYRLYNYDEESNSAEFFRLEGDLSGQVILSPVTYSVHLNNETLH